PRVDPQPLVPLEPRVAGVDAKAPQLHDRAGGEAVAADLLPRERGLLDHEHVESAAGEVVGHGGTSRTRADDQGVDVKLLARRARHEVPHRLVKTFTNDANRLVKLRTNPMPGSSAAASERRSAASGVVPGVDGVRPHAEEPEPPDLLREPREPLTREEGPVLL